MSISAISSSFQYGYQNLRVQNTQVASVANTELEELLAQNTEEEEYSYLYESIPEVEASELFERFRMKSDMKRMELSATVNSSEQSQANGIRSEVENILQMDIESMSDEEVSVALESFQTTIASAQYLPQVAQSLQSTDLTSLSSAEQKVLLQEIQTEAISLESQKGMGPKGPGGPPPGGAPPAKAGAIQGTSTEGTEETEESEETEMEKLLRELLEKLQEGSEEEEETYYSLPEISKMLESMISKS